MEEMHKAVYGSPPLSTRNVLQDPSGCLEPRIALNPIYTMFFLYIHMQDKAQFIN